MTTNTEAELDKEINEIYRQVRNFGFQLEPGDKKLSKEDFRKKFKSHTAKAVEEAELKARFELMIRVLLTLGKNIVISKKSLQEPLERYEIQTYKSPVSSQPGIVYRLLESQEKSSENY